MTPKHFPKKIATLNSKWYLSELLISYLVVFWSIMFFLYIVDYLPWIWPEEYDGNFPSIADIKQELLIKNKSIYDPLILAARNLLIDPIFAFIHFIIFYPKFHSEPDYFRKKSRVAKYILILLFLGLFNSILYKLAQIILPVSESQAQLVSFIRNLPEAIISMVLFTGYWSFYKRNKELEVDNHRLMRRGRDHDFKNLFSYIGIFYTNNSLEEFKAFTNRLSNYSTYLSYDRIKNKISLKTEIDHIENYLVLRTMKHSNQPVVIKNISTNNQNNLFIVPGILIEGIRNAIKHGEHKKDAWFINVSISMQKGIITYEVENSIPEKSNEIENDLNEKEGLAYTKNCLDTYYNNKYNFLYQKNKDKYIFQIKINLN